MSAFAGAGASAYTTVAGNKTSGAISTAAAGDLLVAVVVLSGTTAAPTVSDSQGGSYVEVTGGGALKLSSVDAMRVFVATALLPATASTTLTMTSPGGDTGGGLTCYRVTGMSRSGLLAVRQAAKQQNHAAGTPGPAFGVAALTGNSILGAVFNDTNPATMTAPTTPAMTEKHDLGYATPANGLEVVTLDSGFTGTTITWGSASATEFGSIIVELDASAAPAAPPIAATLVQQAVNRAAVI